MIRFLLWEPKFGTVYLKTYEILQNLSLRKIIEVQDRYADLNTIISDFKKILAPACLNSCLDFLIPISLVTDLFYFIFFLNFYFYYKYGTFFHFNYL